MDLRKVIQSVLPTWNGRIAAHHVCYLGDGHVHRAVPYNATDPKVVAKKLELMAMAGIEVVIGTWQGPHAVSGHLDAVMMSSMCAQMGMQFCLLLDPWCGKLPNPSLGPTQNVINALSDPTTQAMFNASSYVPEKFVLAFDGLGADLVKLGVTFPKLQFLAQGQGFSWISIPKITESKARNAAAVANLKGQNAYPLLKIPGVCMSFDDTGMPLPAGVQRQDAFDAAGGQRDYSKSPWPGSDGKPTAGRVLESFAGQFLLQQLGVTPATAPIIAFITWDDYDEQSSGPLEKVLAELSGVNWSAL